MVEVVIASRTVDAAGTPQVALQTAQITAGLGIAEALRSAGFTLASDAVVALWGKKAALDTVLAGGERIEVCGPLHCDPKLSRKLRFAQKQKQMQAYKVAQALKKKASKLAN
jgi:putative ubiquitin-RnfH superfamily antitoxin RatB of RatAB toxin-antitoxin module